jgi:hypothetical protein
MSSSTNAATGLPEDYFVIPESAPTEWPVDEIDCAITRASAVIALTMMALSDESSREFDITLNSALWSALADVAHISKLAHHHNYEAIHEAARLADSGLTSTSMYLDGTMDGIKPAAYILSDCLALVLGQLGDIRRLSHLEHEERSKLSA